MSSRAAPAVREQVRETYEARAREYTEVLGTMTATAPEDRELISVWAGALEGPVADAGCGPGHWTDFLHQHGVDVEGIDMVEEFLVEASRRFPQTVFRPGLLEALPVKDGSLGGILAWYSIIHTPPRDVAAVLTEFARCLRPGGSLLVGFFEGVGTEPFAHAVAPAYYWPVPAIREILTAAGFEVSQTHSRTDPGHRPHAAVLARRR